MKNPIPPYVQESIDNVMALYDRYLTGTLNLKALDPITVIDLEKDFNIADKHLDYTLHEGLSILRQSLIASLSD